MMLKSFIQRFTGRPIVANPGNRVVDAVLHGPVRPGDNLITDAILGRGPSVTAIPLVPDLFPRNLAVLSNPGDTEELLVAPTGGVWLMKVQPVHGQIVQSNISLGDLDVGFGGTTPGTPFGGFLGPTPIYWTPPDFPNAPVIDLTPGGIFFAGGVRIGLRNEMLAGPMETIFQFSFATRTRQVASVRLGL